MILNRRHLCNLRMLPVLLLLGCAATPTSGPERSAPPYHQVVERYNANLARVQRLWARGIVEARWVEDGRSRFEQGDAHLIMILPDRVAFSLEKLGNTLLWAGCDPRKYWLYDLLDERDKVVYVGAHTGQTPAGGTAGLGPELPGVPFKPLDLPRLLGLVRLGADKPFGVQWHRGQWLIEPPGTHTRMLLDPLTARPTRVDLLDADGYSLVVSRLPRYELMALVGQPPGAYPRVPGRVEVEVVGRGAKMSLSLYDATDDPRKIHERVFDFEVLQRALGPARVIDLDQER